MQTKFLNFITKHHLFKSKDKILLAVSGGADSVAMTHLFHRSDCNFAIAHCNFSLRGQESDEDELFVKQLAKQLNVDFFSKRFETSTYAQEHTISTQMAARELRFNWFEEVAQNNNCHYIAIASHKDDLLETMLINLTKGAVLEGFHGIIEKQGNIIRPMLCFSREEIDNFCKKHTITFRNDSSNASDKYVRNKIRHHVIPVLKAINPNVLETVSKNAIRTRFVEEVYKEAINKKIKNLIEKQGNTFRISIQKLKKLIPLTPYLVELLATFHFNYTTAKSIEDQINNTGSLFLSKDHELLVDREYLVIRKKAQTIEKPETLIYENDTKVLSPVSLAFEKFKKGAQKITFKPSVAYIDFAKIQFPLTVRKWKQGDKFIPFGMKGFKKVSDFLIDEKVSRFEKENIYVITSRKQIIWIVGLRTDNRFKVTDETEEIICIQKTKLT